MIQVIETKVYNIIKEILNSSVDIIGTTKFSEIGISSVTYIKIVIALEDEFQIEFAVEDSDSIKYNYVTDVVKYIDSKLNTRMI